MRTKIIETALQAVKKRFLDCTANRFPKESMEYDVTFFRSKMLFDKTVLGGKNARSHLCLSAYDALKPGCSSEEVSRVAQVAATLEMVQSFYLIIDDVMDESETRRGKPCWYKMPNVGFGAINDALMLEGFVEEVIRETIPSHPNVYRILDAFQRSKRNTILGQLLDTESQYKLPSFTWERYEKIVQFKTSHYTYFHPLETAMLLADVSNGYNDTRKLSYMLGFLFQSQDDFLDVFGDPTVTGKVGTDLNDGKCTWVTVRAFQKLQDHKDLLAEWKESFGKTDQKSIGKLKEILIKLQLEKEFRIFESKFSENILENFKRVDPRLTPIVSVLEQSLEKMTRRVK